MTPQNFVLIQGFFVFVAGIFASRGIISKDTVDWLGGPEFLTVITAIVGAAGVGLAWWKARPKGVINAAGKALDGKGVIVTDEKTASLIPAPNVVGSMEEAEKVAPVRLRRRQHVPPAANA